MIPLLSQQASESGLAYVFSGWSFQDSITFLPAIGLFLLGLVLGVVLVRRSSLMKRRDEVFPLPALKPSEPFVEDLGVGDVREIVEPPSPELPIGEAARKGNETARASDTSGVDEPPSSNREAPAEQRVAGDLALARRLADQRAAELAEMSERFSQLRQQLDEKQRRIEEWTLTFEKAAAQPRDRVNLAEAQLPVMQAAEAIRSERQRTGASLIRLENLEMRLREEDERFQVVAEALTQARSRVGDRLSDTVAAGPAVFSLADRLCQADEHLRVVSQNIRGCVDRIVLAREHLGREQAKLREAAQPIQDAEALFADTESGDDRPLGNVRTLLEQCRERLSRLENGVDQELAEIVGRVEWAVKDSPAAFFKSIDRLNGDETADMRLALIESRVWQDLNGLRGSLDSVQITLESGAATSLGESSGKRRLLDVVGRSLDGVDVASRQPAPIADSGNSPDPALEAEIARLKADAESREAEIARLTNLSASSESAMAALRDTIDSLQNRPEPAPETLSTPPPHPAETPVPTKKSQSRLFISRLLGLGPGKREGSLVEGAPAPVTVAASVPTLADARVIVGELRHVEIAERVAEALAGHHAPPGMPALIAGPTETEIAKLERQLESRDARITALERELDALKRAKIQSAPEPTAAPGTESQPVPQAPASLTFAGILPGDTIPDRKDETVLFRGRDPRLWNTRSDTTRPIDTVPDGIGYLRLRRLDTDESVVTPITRAELLAGGSPKARLGWSGRGEQYFGACHLGLFDETLPREVETKFGAGGWGFGHLESVGSGQAYAWAGHAIADPGEGFEISVAFLPGEMKLSTRPSAAAREPKAVAPESEDAQPLDLSPEQAEAFALMTVQSDNRISGLVLFRANDPVVWGKNAYGGVNHRARSLDLLPPRLAYLRLRRIDTGEGVVVAITNDSLTSDGDGQQHGFNGSGEIYYGARHLGVFDEGLPQDFETRFTFGGWGFGHSISAQDRQSSGWEGRPISSDTVFEIAVFRRMPVLAELDRLVE